MIATLGKVGTGFDLGNEKRYDAWGAVRSGSGVGSHIVNPNTGYCANLGHKFDGESDMPYMRARYYEPSTGRFISEDPAMDGANWYVYCENDPILAIDSSGDSAGSELLGLVGNILVFVGMLMLGGFEFAKDYAKDFLRAKVLAFLGKWVGAPQFLVESINLALEVFSTNVTVAQGMGWASLYSRWTGYFIIIYGQCYLTPGDLLDPTGENVWWRYETSQWLIP